VKILFDNNVPLYLLPEFPDASTAYREGWQELTNGRLLEVAEAAGFALLITLDQGFETQQSLVGKSISIATLKPGDQSRDSFIRIAKALAEGLDDIGPGTVVSLD
jgi:predicted nuclease of predicted toxin-antitoxin system